MSTAGLILPRDGEAEAHLDLHRREVDERARQERIVARQLAIRQTMKEILEHREVEIAQRARQAMQREAQETNFRPVSARSSGGRRSTGPSGRGHPGGRE